MLLEGSGSDYLSIKKLPNSSISRVELSNNRRLLGTTLLQIILPTSSKGASEPRDRIFALYDALLAKGVPLAQPDYRVSLGDLYTRTTRTIIEHDHSLDILNHISSVTSPVAGSPSWSYCWSGLHEPEAISPQLFQATGRDMKGRAPALHFEFSEDGAHLRIKGKKLDRISSCTRPGIADEFNEKSEEALNIRHARTIHKTVHMFQEWVRLWGKLPSFPSYLVEESGAITGLASLLIQDGSMVLEGWMRTDLPDGCPNWYSIMTVNMRKDDQEFARIRAQVEDTSNPDPLVPDWLPPDLHEITQTEEWTIYKAICQDR